MRAAVKWPCNYRQDKVSRGPETDLPSRVLVVSRRKTEKGTDTVGEEGIMLQAAAAVMVEAAEAAEGAEKKIPFQDVAASRSSSAASGCSKAAPVLLYFPAVGS